MTDSNRKSSLRCRRKISEIIVHCSATRTAQDFCAADVRRWHLERGFTDIGYHFLVRLDGTVETGRPLDKIGAHCLGHNRNSIGVCYVGGLDMEGKPADTRTEAQKDSLLKLLTALRQEYPAAAIHSHRDFAKKECPCFDATKEYSLI